MADKTKGTGTSPRTKKGARRQNRGTKRFTSWHTEAQWGTYEKNAPKPERRGGS